MTPSSEDYISDLTPAFALKFEGTEEGRVYFDLHLKQMQVIIGKM